jgi:hypothetical protein
MVVWDLGLQCVSAGFGNKNMMWTSVLSIHSQISFEGLL